MLPSCYKYSSRRIVIHIFLLNAQLIVVFIFYLTIKYQCITLDLALIILHLLANHVFMIIVILLPGCFLKGPIDQF